MRRRCRSSTGSAAPVSMPHVLLGLSSVWPSQSSSRPLRVSVVALTPPASPCPPLQVWVPNESADVGAARPGLTVDQEQPSS
jgi:hypothetical protein